VNGQMGPIGGEGDRPPCTSRRRGRVGRPPRSPSGARHARRRSSPCTEGGGAPFMTAASKRRCGGSGRRPAARSARPGRSEAETKPTPAAPLGSRHYRRRDPLCGSRALDFTRGSSPLAETALRVRSQRSGDRAVAEGPRPTTSWDAMFRQARPTTTLGAEQLHGRCQPAPRSQHRSEASSQ